MKKKFKFIIVLTTFILLIFSTTAIKAQGPPDPPEDPGTGGGPVGGGAPIGDGIIVLTALAALYGVKKHYNQNTKIKV